MRFKCGLSEDELWKIKRATDAEVYRLKNWHPWFAWHPVTIERGRCVWLERVERCFQDAWYPSYQDIPRIRRYNPKYRIPE